MRFRYYVLFSGIVFFLLAYGLYSCSLVKNPQAPNVILVMTDDQGIGDIGCHGNPWLKTPNLDEFYNESVRLTDFHVSPVCTPTRGAIMTGLYPIRNGAWATYKGRDAITRNNPLLAEVFRDNGYETAMFGKWHLGDNFPTRPTDCGFDLAIHHKAGGVGELSDYWGNSYFDDTYMVNNEPRSFTGYCTDVWFEEAMKFIREKREKPFFVYIPTNAPHGPFYVDEKYAEPYVEGQGEYFPNSRFYGMIANIDENFGKLVDFMEEEGISENTILIFMTDNGSGGGVSNDEKLGWNHGFSGRKGSLLEGGHRVPFFIRWPAAGIEGGRDLKNLAAHVDLLPTLAGLCGIDLPEEIELDGFDLSGLMLDNISPDEERIVYVHYNQDWRPPHGVKATSVAMGKWRLVDGEKLFDLQSDRGQMKNIAGEYPDIVRDLREKNRIYTESSSQREEYKNLPASMIGHEDQKVITLTIQHAIGDDRPIWKAEHVAQGDKVKNSRHILEAAVDGNYRISCARWPRECQGPILGVPDENPKQLYTYEIIQPQKVRLRINELVSEKDIRDGDKEVYFDVNLKKGRSVLEINFIEEDEQYGVYYAYVEKLD